MVSLGGLLIKPYGAWSLIAIKAMNSVVPDAAISYGLFMEIMLPVSIVCFAAYIAFGRFVLRLDVGKLASFKASGRKSRFFFRTKNVRYHLIVVGSLFICAIFLASFLAADCITK